MDCPPILRLCVISCDAADVQCAPPCDFGYCMAFTTSRHALHACMHAPNRRTVTYCSSRVGCHWLFHNQVEKIGIICEHITFFWTQNRKNKMIRGVFRSSDLIGPTE
jgi:hypothetical protein